MVDHYFLILQPLLNAYQKLKRRNKFSEYEMYRTRNNIMYQTAFYKVKKFLFWSQLVFLGGANFLVGREVDEVVLYL